uniref:Phospholipase A2 receptor 1 n=1 Tax=Oryzias latipes TaxID=8090 RepID=A0A3P9I5P8_ORYLA
MVLLLQPSQCLLHVCGPGSFHRRDTVFFLHRILFCFCPGKGLFILESILLKRCIKVDHSSLVLEDCQRPTRRMLWKWVSSHRLYNLGTGMCLGLDILNTTHPLGMFECDKAYTMMWWRCRGNTLYGAFQWKVTGAGRLVVVKKSDYYEWKRHRTPREGPCSYPYEDIHTLLGNANGMPCVFPFNYNNKWYAECTTEGREDNLHWCSTTPRYDRDERWGFCPVKGKDLQACYQFNLYTILTWSQALATCQAQGGNLLSITSMAEQKYIRDRLSSVGTMVWIGLNHLKEGQGWQWSDGAPLSLVNFIPALPASPLQVNRECGVYNSAYAENWQSLSCESALPYICKKMPNDTRRAEPLENWQYIHTKCDDGWWPHNGFCYRVLPDSEAGSWQMSSEACSSQGANLTSIHSLSELEMLLFLLANENLEVWIGLWKPLSSPAVEWSDGSPVTLTLWQQFQPVHNLTETPLCAKLEKKKGNWLLVSCDERLSAVCRRESRSPGWKRHGHSCYTVTSHEQTYEDALMGFYCKAPLLTVENRFEQTFVNSLLSASGANCSRDYWIGLTDRENKGEYSWLPLNGSSPPLTFTNWNKHQPVSSGGCVAMSGGPALGHWEVKDCKSYKALSVCEQSVSSYHGVELPEHHIDAYAPCPPGWESQSGLLHCFKVFHDEKVLMKRSWVEADFFCQALGAQLASFHHHEEQDFVNKHLSTMFEGTEGRWFWLGFNKRNPEHPGVWEWSDGSPVSTDKNEEDDRKDCAVYSDLTSTLTPQPCDAKHEWICKVSRGKCSKTGVHVYINAFDQQSTAVFCRRSAKKNPDNVLKSLINRIINRIEFFSRWSDNTEVEFQNWVDRTSHGSPKKSRMCATMSSSIGKWSLNKCSELHGYVCKRMTVSVVETPREPHYIGGCPEKWLYFGHKCLLLHLPDSPKEGKSWRDAQSICSSFDGSLVAIEDEIEQAYITMLLQGSFVGVWIGLRDEDTMKWINGRPVIYTNWSPVEPRTDEPLCTVLSNNHNFHLTGKWYDEKCSDSEYGFVCQKPQDISKPPTHSYHHPLPENIEYRSSSYKALSGNMSWEDALTKCHEKGSKLVSITDAYHQAFLTVLVNRLAVPHWIGLYSSESGINYRWSDGSEIMYTHWDTADDEDDFVSEVCVYIDVNGGWRRADCKTLLPGALCYVSPTPPSSESYISDKIVCPSSWVNFEQWCYNFEHVIEKHTFEESREHCRHLGVSSNLLTITSKKENDFILEQLWSSGFIHQSIWLGMNFNIDTNSMEWVDSLKSDYTNWANKGPDVKRMTADTCVSTTVVGGVWHMSSCTERLGFICKSTAGWLKTARNYLCFHGIHTNSARFHSLPALRSAYYRHTSSQATESDGNVLITDLETHSGE